VTAEHPWDHIEIDMIGSLPVSEKGNAYILTVVDVCTGYVVLRATKTKDMGTIAQKLWKMMSEYGTPKIIQSDNRSEFTNQMIGALAELYGIEQQLITAYNPRANRLVEQANKEISRTLKKFVEGSYGAWDLWLPLVQVSMNKVVGTRTKSTAFSLMHARRFNGFVDFSKTQTISNIDKAMQQRNQ
jgi:transposase InsO family protein